MPPRKRASAKKAATPEPVEASTPEGLAPVRIGQRSAEPEKRVTLFYIDDVPHTIPERASVQRGLQFLRESRDPKVGFAAAVDNLALDLIGEDNLRALEDSPKTTREDIAEIMSVVRQIVLGGPTVMQEAAEAGNS